MKSRLWLSWFFNKWQNFFLGHWATGLRVWLTYGLVLIFFALIFLAPFAWNGTSVKDANFINNLYLVVSAASNTGLTTYDIGGTMTEIGQVIILFLMIIGGVGLLFFKISLFQFVLYFFNIGGRYIDFNEQSYERGGSFSSNKVRRMLVVSFYFLLLIEFIGFLFFFFIFFFNTWDNSVLHEKYSLDFWTSAWHAVFHSVSATNNSGFDIFTGGTSLIPFANFFGIQIVFIVLFVLGGIGFPIFLNIWDYLKKKFIAPNASNILPKNYFFEKFVLTIYFLLAFFGIAVVFIFEATKKGITTDASNQPLFLAVVFNVMSARSAGFSTVDIGTYFSEASRLVITALMFIGTSPLSTGGGIKTTAFGLVILAVLLARDRKHNIIIKRRSISATVVENAQSTVILSLIMILFGTIISLFAFSIINKTTGVTDTAKTTTDYLFYFSSALGNVGLTTFDLTNEVADKRVVFKFYTIFLMLFGQIGVSSIFSKRGNIDNKKLEILPYDIPL